MRALRTLVLAVGATTLIAAGGRLVGWLAYDTRSTTAALAPDPVAGEPQADHADEDREDDAERVRRQREGEQRAEDAADSAEDAEAQRKAEIADPAAA